MTKFIVALKFFLFLLLCVAVIPTQSLVLLFHKGKFAYILPWLWQKGACAIFSIRVKIIGQPYTKTQTLYISNHISYLDIPAIGSILRGSFVAKKDVASWPVFGFLSTLQQTAFISRDKTDAKREKNTLDAMLSQGKSLIIFPEGTSTDGKEVLPFKSSLFSIVMKPELKDMFVQPITLSMESVDNRAVKTQEDRDIYSWHINMDMPLEQHLKRFSKSKGATICLTFHTPFRVSEFDNRKTLAKACQNTVSNGLKNIS